MTLTVSVAEFSSYPVLSLRVYDPAEQPAGVSACGASRGGCQHLCLPVSPTEARCSCAVGFSLDPADNKTCNGGGNYIALGIIPHGGHISMLILYPEAQATAKLKKILPRGEVTCI